MQGPVRKRDIVEMTVNVSETRHCIDTAKCAQCSKIIEAPHDLPRNRSYGKCMVGLVAVLRGARIPFRMISEVIKELTGTKIATSTVLYAYARAADAMHSDAKKNMKKIARAKSAGFDETMHRDSGKSYWMNVARSGNLSYSFISNSRATRLLDEMDYGGIATTDMYAGYKRFGKDGKQQCCWAHVSRQMEHLSEKLDPNLPEPWRERRRGYREKLMWLFVLGKTVAASGAHSRAWREWLEGMLAKVLDRYCNTDDADLEKHVRMMERHLHGMFTFVEHPGVEPTNNASERALRYYVVFRKVSGHTRGGARAMRRLGDFVSCMVTWRNEGKSIMAEVARLV